MNLFKTLNNLCLFLGWDILRLVFFLLAIFLSLHSLSLVFDIIELSSHCSHLFAKSIRLSSELLCLVNQFPLLIDCFFRLTDLALGLADLAL